MSRNLRIIHCLRAPVGGLFRHVVDLAVEQSLVGHEVGVIYDSSTVSPSITPQLELLNQRCSLGVRSVKMPRLLHFSDYTAFRAVKKFALDTDAQILHGHGAKGGAYARLACSSLKKSKTPCLSFYTPHGGSLHYSPSSIKGKLFLGLERTLAKQTNGLIFESAYSSNIYHDVVGRGFCRTKVIPNGLKADEFISVPLHPDAAEFLFIGELRHLKGVDLLLEAFASLLKETPSIRLAIVGDGPDMQLFQNQAESLSISSQVKFHGRLPARDAFALGAVMVVPSRAESFPYIVLEAGAGLKPLICSDVGGISEIVTGTSTELIVPEDVDDLYSAMKHSLSQPERMMSQAEQLQTSIKQKFTIERMASDITDFYLSALKR
ncbi:MAG: transferase [Methyloligella sp.]|nr:MAG: transferase [Methyloligella sp.]